MIDEFLAYALAFEKTVVDDDWTRLERFFTPDAVYLPGDGSEIRGRKEILAHLKASLDGFDRRFDARRLEPTGEPVVDGDTLTVAWRATYDREGHDPVVIGGTERATFVGSAISRLEDSLDEGVVETIQRWTERFDRPSDGGGSGRS